MEMKFDISQVQAQWAANTAKRVAIGLAEDGVGLPGAVALSFRDYLRDVRNVTPPAGGGTLLSVSYQRGKTSITVDLRKAFRVVTQTIGGRAATAEKALSWLQGKRNSRGRFAGGPKLTVTTDAFKGVETFLHSRVGALQSGWNAASKKFGVSAPNWAQNKTTDGSVQVTKTESRFGVRATNNAKFANQVTDMQRRLDYAAKRQISRLEAAAKLRGETQLQEAFGK